MRLDWIWQQVKKRRFPPPEFLKISAATNTGLLREENEDHFCADSLGIGSGASDTRQRILAADILRTFAVFDGMGGEAFGGDCSRIAAVTLSEHLRMIRSGSAGGLSRKVDEFVTSANRRIGQMLDERAQGRGGCTMALACISAGRVYVYSIGDSRVYYFRQGQIRQVTEDQTVAAQKYRNGIFTAEEAQHSPDAHRLLAYLGAAGILQALSYPSFALEDGKVLICSDGLTDMCTDSEIAALLGAERENHAQALVNAAIANGGADNITCIVIEATGHN
ncbi:MAG: protein phosphatase 2C domain-containing protein [Oscillospiraceae bacterium]|nr:protein phosphatase 2C domain-containing protein [Oscillospiraceae bacterium]